MKIGPKLSSSRRKFNKDHRSSRKAKNAAHDAKVKLWRTRRKLLTHMKATSIRKYGSSAKVYPRRDGKQPKYMRLRRKNVPLPFSPLWTRNSPPTQYSYKRNEVRNPSAVYLYDSVQDTFRPIRKAKSTSFAEFIDWDREAFQGPHGRSVNRDLLKPIGWNYRPAVIGDTVAAKPLEPLQIDLPPITSGESCDEDVGDMDEETEPIASQDFVQLTNSSDLVAGLKIYSELPEAGPLLISDSSLYCDTLPAEDGNPTIVDPTISALDTPDPSGGLSSNAPLRGSAFRIHSATNALSEYCSVATNNGLGYFSLPPGLEDCATFPHGTHEHEALGLVDSCLSPVPSVNEHCLPSSSGRIPPLHSIGSGLLLASFPSFATNQQNRAIGERLAASVSASSNGLAASLSGRHVDGLPVILLENASKPPLGKEYAESLLYPTPKAQKPGFDASLGGQALPAGPKLLQATSRSAFVVQCKEQMLIAPDMFLQCTSKVGMDIEMESLPVYVDGVVVEQEKRWSWSRVLRSLATVVTTAFLSPWRLVLGMVMRGR